MHGIWEGARAGRYPRAFNWARRAVDGLAYCHLNEPNWLREATEPRSRPFIRRGGGGMAPLNLLPSASSHLGFFLPSATARGHAGALMVATRVSARHHAPPSQEFVVEEPTMRGRGRGRERGRCGARGRGGQGSAPSSPPLAVPPPMEGHVGDQHHELFIRMRRPVHRRLRLRTPLAREMEVDPP